MTSGSAVICLTARDSPPAHENSGDDTNVRERVEIRHHIPKDPEHVLIGQQFVHKDIEITPTAKVNVAGHGVEFSGVGQNHQKTDQKDFTISLIPKLSTHRHQPDCTQW
jgi:hypothetical protein